MIIKPQVHEEGRKKAAKTPIPAEQQRTAQKQNFKNSNKKEEAFGFFLQ